MKTKTIAFIGHRKIENYRELKKLLRNVISKLIEEENAETFLFSGIGSFDTLCLDTATDMKRYYPLIKRIYVRARYEQISNEYEKYLLLYYDKTFFPYEVKGAGYRSYVRRNQVMVDMCDILVTYYDVDYKLLSGKNSGTKTAVEYALKKNTRIINLYEFLK